MCAHPDHEGVTLPDGQVSETHVLPDEDMGVITERALDRLLFGTLFTSPVDDIRQYLKKVTS
ncbi:hypothetical protein HEK616_41100 [Streptomyces nigrescens]|uniref:Uncharacterized protein n=1 Tax=Streptomyces nigrescens TaxID=1920 RepID=A0ABM7ZWC1_STRNI|nr:hypothetical protein [Streptomyces nigrescens]BDM70623.1 hypothetical protein HEK616_41100 [Streptomyces nigrescens]